MSSGVEGKWAAMNEEREELKEENSSLKARVGELEGRLASFDGTDLAQVTEQREAIEKEIAALRKDGAKSLLKLAEDEQEAMDAVNVLMRLIVNRWKLRTNSGEFVAAIHVVQSFVYQRMLSRLAPKEFSNWWADGKEKESR